MVHQMLNMKQMPSCVGIIGSREFSRSAGLDMKMYETVRKFVFKLPIDTEIVSGGAEGIDSYAEDAAYLRKMRRQIYRRKKGLKGRKAVIDDIVARNTKIVQHVYKHEGVLVAFMHEDMHKGTSMTIGMAQKLGVPVIEMMFDRKGNFVLMVAPTEYLIDRPDEIV